MAIVEEAALRLRVIWATLQRLEDNEGEHL